MTNNIYRIDLLAGSPVATVTDDGIGSDWLVNYGTIAGTSRIILGTSTNAAGVSTSATATYNYVILVPNLGPIFVNTSLFIKGLVENARGTIGQDYIEGNEQNNIIFGDNSATGIGGNDTLFGFNGNDTLYGGAGKDEIYGGGGADYLRGDAGADTVDGGSGRDTIIGDLGADSLNGGSNAGDLLNYAASNASINVVLDRQAATSGVGGFAESDSIYGFSDVVGSAFNDIIFALSAVGPASGSALNHFYGGGGDDYFVMANGNDSAFGGAGADLIFLDSGADRADGGTGADSICGGTGNDTIFGGAGNDSVIGGSVNSLEVKSSEDHLYGGLGADNFVYFHGFISDTLIIKDVVHDFSRAQGDHMYFANADANPDAPGLQTFNWRGASAFTGAAGQLRVINVGANSLILGDLDGDKSADFSIEVLGVNNMIKSDFLLLP